MRLERAENSQLAASELSRDDGLVLPESAAIFVYLAKKSGRLIPGDRAGEAQVVRWCFAAMSSVELPLLSLLMLDWTADGGCGKHREFLVRWANRALTMNGIRAV